jgi:Holliday junction resolvase RusA-like endonuclease
MTDNKIFPSRKFNFSIELPPTEIRGNHRSHFRTFRNHYNAYQEQGLVSIGNALVKQNTKIPFVKVIVIYTFYNNMLIDLDNFAYGMKAILDALVHRDVLEDDNALNVNPISRYRKCIKAERRADILILDTSKYENISISGETPGDSDFLLTL